MNAEYPIITIGREIGSGGLAIAKILSENLEIPLYDKTLLSLASKDSGLEQVFFEKADEKDSYNFFQKALNNVFENQNNFICNEDLFKFQSETIKKIAATESCIFVGRCADYILRERQNVMSLFFCATIEDRIKNMTKNLHLPQKQILKLIEQTDKKRSAYYNFYTNKTWGKAASYDICINTSLLGIEKSALVVLDIFRKRFRTCLNVIKKHLND